MKKGGMYGGKSMKGGGFVKTPLKAPKGGGKK